jgi:hypothetical protein
MHALNTSISFRSQTPKARLALRHLSAQLHKILSIQIQVQLSLDNQYPNNRHASITDTTFWRPNSPPTSADARVSGMPRLPVRLSGDGGRVGYRFSTVQRHVTALHRMYLHILAEPIQLDVLLLGETERSALACISFKSCHQQVL